MNYPRILMIFSLVFLISTAIFVHFKEVPPAVDSMNIDNTELLEYANEIGKLGNFNMDKINSVKFYDGSKEKPNKDGNTTIGWCQRGFYKGDILINDQWWKNASHRQKMLVMGHELFHCACDLDHTEKVKEDGCPKDYMYYLAPSNWCIYKHYNEYYKQFEKGCSL